MQKRAAQELFDWLSLDVIPIVYWRIVSEALSPADALARLIVRSGLDPLKIRRRDSIELKAFRAIVRSICQHETVVRSICKHEQSPGSVPEHAGDDILLREAFVMLDDVLNLFRALRTTSRIKRFSLLATRVERLRQRPDSVTIEEASAALEEARGLAAASWRYTAAAERYRTATSELSVGWARWTPTIHDNAERQRLIETATTAERYLFDDEDCDIEEQLCAYAAASNALQSLVHARKAAEEEQARQIEEKRRRNLQEESRRWHRQEEVKKWEQGSARIGTSAKSDKEPSQMSLDELLVFFSFAPGSRPTSSQLKNAFVDMAQRTQPRPGDVNFVSKNLRYRQVIDAFKTLKATMNH